MERKILCDIMEKRQGRRENHEWSATELEVGIRLEPEEGEINMYSYSILFSVRHGQEFTRECLLLLRAGLIK